MRDEYEYVVDIDCTTDELTLFQKYRGEILRKVKLTKWQRKKLGFQD